ncbi:hypothetical protein T9H88_02680 [Staphylococcus aureus]|nr:hypothetical protein T9H88_02680 [Staphylococcus aureus]
MLIGVGAKHAKDELRELLKWLKFLSFIHYQLKQSCRMIIPYSIGNLGKIGTKTSYQTMQEADLLIMVGTNYPYVDYLPKKILKPFKLTQILKISDIVSILM